MDCTLGGGGHTQGFLRAFLGNPRLAHHKVLGIDQDAQAIARAQNRFSQEIREGSLVIQQARFSQLQEIAGSRPVLGILADLGFSSDQINSPERGLSFQNSGPLDMRLDPSQGMTCLEYLQAVSEKDLADVIYEFGEERFSRQIASAITQARRSKNLPKTSSDLAQLIWNSVPSAARHGRIHPATRTFQALRIVINGEMEELDSLLNHGMMILKPGGRVAIISFHSLEDRKVKQVFKGKDSAFEQLSKKPQVPDDDEIRTNPRSRSAKLRIAERVTI